MNTIRQSAQKKPWIPWVLFALTVGVVFVLGLLSTSIMERRVETLYIDRPKIKIEPLEPRSEMWGINYPNQYDSWKATTDTSFMSKYNGNANIDMLQRYPALVILWAGYGFAKDYNQSKGHMYAVSDIHRTLRTGAPDTPNSGPMPSTCWSCKSPDAPRLMSELGTLRYYGAKWAWFGSEHINPIGCADCHDEKTMNLKITRPALLEAFERRGMDINQVTHQEMRSLVCAQCHVEYYFDKNRPDAKGVPYLTFPWDKGTTAEAMEEYYDNLEFSDWIHKLSKAPMLKAQHPGYELYQQGIHARRGVSCADCHMPYRSEGGVKFTDHKIQSPLNNMANSCMVCHRESEKELTASVYSNMDKVLEARTTLEDLLVKLHLEAEFAWKQGASEEQMQDVLQDIRHAQWRWDYAAASHGGAFHAPVEALRIISSGIERAQGGRLKLARLLSSLGFDGEVPMPDLSTKAKAQAYIGLDMPTLNAEKKKFLEEIVPQWLREGAAREAKYPAAGVTAGQNINN